MWYSYEDIKLIILAVVLAVMQTAPPVPRQTPNNPTSASQGANDQSGPNNAPATPPQAPVNANAAPEDRQSHDSVGKQDAQKPIRVIELPPVSITKDKLDRIYWLFSALLVVVGFLQVLLLFQTRRAIEKQANKMEEQRAVMASQLGAIQQQAVATESAAATAQESIDLARAQFNLMMEKERARISIKAVPIQVQEPDKEYWNLATSIEIRNLGQARAFVTRTDGNFVIRTEGEKPSDEVSHKFHFHS